MSAPAVSTFRTRGCPTRPFGPAWWPEVLTVVVLVLGTLVSEDLTCITAGLLIQRGELGLTAGMVACTAGIFAGDMGLWLLRRLFGVAALAWPWAVRALKRGRAEETRAWLGRHAAAAIVGSRFLPGTRLPLYLVAGVLGFPGSVFATWALVGSLLWTPTLVLLTATLGDAFVARMRPLVGVGWGFALLAAAVAFLLLRLIRFAAGKVGKMRVGARLARWARW